MKVIVIGAGFGGLSVAIQLAYAGYEVQLIEKNAEAGGRAAQWKKDGFTFDIGPSWFMMPDVFERFFASIGKEMSEYIELERLDPSYRVYFNKDEFYDVSADLEKNIDLFESIEPGAGQKLKQYLKKAETKYELSHEYIYRVYNSIVDFVNPKLLWNGLKLNVFSTFHNHVASYFKDSRLQKIVEFMVVFLGGSPQNVLALYSLISHADFGLGIWYPKGGMYAAVEGLVKLAEELGVEFIYNSPVTRIYETDAGQKIVEVSKQKYEADIVVANADYQYVDQHLLDSPDYTAQSWDKKVLSPSTLLFFLGIDKKLDNFEHHTLFLHRNWDTHFDDIFKDPKWPDKPLYYVSMTSKTDEDVAPKGMENLYILVPIAAGLEDTENIREEYYNDIMDDLEYITSQSIRDHVILKRSYALTDFERDYNSYKGGAFGLAHTLFQTAVFRPSHKSKKLKGLYYVGQYTVPGVSLPMTIISGEVVAKEIQNDYK